MTIFNRAFEILASDAFVSSLDDEADLPTETPEPQPDAAPTVLLRWGHAQHSYTGVPNLSYDTAAKLWRIRYDLRTARKHVTSARLLRALELWHEYTGGDLARARAALRERGLL